MNAVEIEQAVSDLARQPFDPQEFPYAFLQAFGNKETTLARLRSGAMNKSDVGGVLQTNNIHLAVATAGQATKVLVALKVSPATTKAKAKFVLATDGETLEAEDLESGETVACAFADFPDHFGFFLSLAGITTVQQIRESSFDIRATSRLNRLYVELLKDNPDWSAAERRPAMNHFMARLIFSFFAEDTNIFRDQGLFTKTIETMTERDSSNTHEVIGQVFRAMNTKKEDRTAAGLPRWTDGFPYVNGGLFAGEVEVPRFSKIARTYLVHIGHLDWTKINPDIFGSMIQAVADDEERGALGMHYTSVPNILKVLNPLFLDDLRAELAKAGENPRLLLNLRKRMSRIRVFDPACGSGNFLVIAYKEMRAIEAEVIQRRGEAGQPTSIPLTNFRGIELRDFPAEIARLALIIAEFQCDVMYRGQKLALDAFLPLDSQNWITCGNAMRLDWLSLCPPTGTGVKHYADDLFSTPLDQVEIDFENEGGETYICGNPPYLGSVYQDDTQKAELESVWAKRTSGWKSLDYVAAWFLKAVQFGRNCAADIAFVATKSICQGEQVPILWPEIAKADFVIKFAYSAFKWSNLATNKAGVTVTIVGLSKTRSAERRLYSVDDDGTETIRVVESISPYIVPGAMSVVSPSSTVLCDLALMIRGNMPNDGGHLILNRSEANDILRSAQGSKQFVKPFVGSRELIGGTSKYCLWIEDREFETASAIPAISERIEKVRQARSIGGKQARDNVGSPHRFVFAPHRDVPAIVVPRVSSENRPYLPVGVTNGGLVIGDRNFALYDAPLWNMALIASRLHWVWIGTVCVRMRTDFSYSNTLGWNTFPVPALTEKNKADLTRCAEDILLTREAHFPATIADLYDPETMPADLRQAHERNDEVLERIYIGRRFRNDTERLEKLFELYTKMVGTRK